MTEHSGKDLHISLLQTSAAFSVVLLHSSVHAILQVPNVDSINWWVANIVNSSVRWCVPVFVMISGYLLLDPDKNERAVVFYAKRGKRILLPLVFWTVFYLFLRARSEELTVQKLCYLIITARPYYHLCFLFMIPGLYLVTPFLRIFIKKTSSKERWRLIVLILLTASIYTVVKSLLLEKDRFFLIIFIPYLGYYLCGYQLRHIISNKLSFKLSPYVTLVFLCIVCIAIGTGFFVSLLGIPKGLFLYHDLSPLVIILSISVFFLLCSYANNLKPSSNNWIVTTVYHLTEATFGIYLIHPVFIPLTRRFAEKLLMTQITFFVIPITALMTFVLSYIVVKILTNIPYVRCVV